MTDLMVYFLYKAKPATMPLYTHTVDQASKPRPRKPITSEPFPCKGELSTFKHIHI